MTKLQASNIVVSIGFWIGLVAGFFVGAVANAIELQPALPSVFVWAFSIATFVLSGISARKYIRKSEHFRDVLQREEAIFVFLLLCLAMTTTATMVAKASMDGGRTAVWIGIGVCVGCLGSIYYAYLIWSSDEL